IGVKFTDFFPSADKKAARLMPPLILVVIVLALLFGFLNGMHDSRNVVSTMISSRAYSPRVALGVTALAEFAGPFVFGVAVANAIGRGIVDSDAINQQVLIVALASAILWNLITWFMRVPSSSSHALIGGILGAASMRAGAQVVMVNGLLKILISLFASPIIGFVFGFLVLRLILVLSWNATPRINDFFKNSQLVTALVLGLSHGSNDSQKTMGIITLALVAGGYLGSFAVPLWVVTLCALALAFGTAVGGWRLIHRVGGSFYKIRPVDGFATQVTSAIVIIAASLVGGPVSATQVINSAIMGIGTAERANKVRWGIAQEIVTAWIFTIPAAALVAAALYLIVTRIGI
ncbi:MAG: inorganic phosphate transporter, partial [Anaerolineae bacterium]|nr:inorganic phosphate transporter [Anaerolineae bacterium]